jgi:hypothetical protein
MQVSNSISGIKPAWVFFVFVFFDQFINHFYALQALDAPGPYVLLAKVAYLWLMWWWLTDDSRHHGAVWPLDLGFFLLIGGVFLLAYHLFQTRGLRAFIPILFFIFIWLCGSVVALVFFTFLK